MGDSDLKPNNDIKQGKVSSRARFHELFSESSSDDDIIPPTPGRRKEQSRKTKSAAQLPEPKGAHVAVHELNVAHSSNIHPMDEYVFNSNGRENLMKLRNRADRSENKDSHHEEKASLPQSRKGLRKSASYSEAIENNLLPALKSTLPDLSAWAGPSTSTSRQELMNAPDEGRTTKKGKKRRSNPLACLLANESPDAPKPKRRKNDNETPIEIPTTDDSASESDSPTERRVPLVMLSDSSDLDSDEWEHRVLSGACRRKSHPKLPENHKPNVGYLDANDPKSRDESIGVSLISKRSPIFSRGRRSNGAIAGPSTGAVVAPTRDNDEDRDDSLIILDWINSGPRREPTPGGTMRTPRMSRRRERTLSGTPVYIRRERQLEGDQRLARQLQEQMDMEYAMSLANEQPPTENAIGNLSLGHHLPNHVTRPTVAPLGLEIRSPVHISPRRLRNSRSRRVRRNDGMHDGMNLLQRMMSPSSSEDDSLGGSLFRRYYPSTLTGAGLQRRARGRRTGTAHYAAGPAHSDGGLGLMLDSPGAGAGARGDYEYFLALGELMGEAKGKGLSKTNIEQLPTLKYEKKPGSQSDEHGQCSVCMTGYEVGEDLRMLPCFHNFHKQCIDKWIGSNATCPICRVAVRLDGQTT